MQYDKEEELLNFTPAERDILGCFTFEPAKKIVGLYFGAIERLENNTVDALNLSQSPCGQQRRLAAHLMSQNQEVRALLEEMHQVGAEVDPEFFAKW